MRPSLAVRLGPLSLANPVVLASGTCGFGVELAPFFDPRRLGAVTLKGLTLHPRAGNPPPRLVEVDGGVLNAIGLQNPGWEGFVRDKYPEVAAAGFTAIANVSGSDQEGYADLCGKLSGLPAIAAIELNVSCPNVREGGILFGQDPAVLGRLVKACRAATAKPLLVKLSPNVTDVPAFARVCEEEGADALSLINTLLGMRIDVRTRRPVLANVTGGLAGGAIRPVAVRIVHAVHRACRLPILGMGGIGTWEHAVEFLLAGASAVAIGTAGLADPLAAIKVLEGLTAYLEKHGIADVNELVGAVRTGDAPVTCQA